MAVEQPLREPRWMLFREILGAKALHGGDERRRILREVEREPRIGIVDQELPADRQVIAKRAFRIPCDCSGGDDAAAQHQQGNDRLHDTSPQ